MPPRSYIITAVALAAAVAVSFPLTLGFSILLWYWLFGAAACVLAVAGAFQIASALRAPLWVAIAFVSPGVIWAATNLLNMTTYTPGPAIFTTFHVAAYLARLAAAAGALRLVETVSAPHAAFRIGYWVLAAAALLMCVSVLAYAMGWSFTKTALYATSARTVGVAAILVKYGAFIGAAVLITMRRGIERWTGITVSLVSAYLLYQALRPLFVTDLPGRSDLPMMLLPVVMLIGAAAVWRMGSVLRASPAAERAAPA